MLIKESWEQYKEKIIPSQASELQIKCMEMAFYAGCTTIMTVNEILGKTEISEDEGCKILSGLMKECLDYMKNAE